MRRRDYLNRLTQYVGLTSTSTYAYDPSNERIKSTVVTGTSTVTTYYPTKSYNTTDGVPTKHIFANGVMVATITGTGASSTVSYILTDHLTGSNVVTDASGTIIELTDYYPYGAVRLDDRLGSNEQRKFAGHEYDSSTGLSYMGARYYDAGYGRFLSQDPAFLGLSFDLSDPQGLNSYAYARNNPLKYLDPDGKSFTSSYVSGFKSQLSSLGNWLAQPTPVVVGQFLKGTFYDTPKGFVQDVGSGQFADSYAAGLNAWSHKTSEQRADAFGDIAGGLTVQGGFSLAVGGLAGLAEGAIGSASIGGGARSYREYPSFSAFKRGEGPAGPGMDWHHIVEQNPMNKAQFTAEQLQNTRNIIAVPRGVHRSVSGYYSRVDSGVRLRDAISSLSYSEQNSYGRSILGQAIQGLLIKK